MMKEESAFSMPEIAPLGSGLIMSREQSGPFRMICPKDRN